VNMRAIFLALLAVFGLACAASSAPASHATSAAGDPAPTAASCPSGSEHPTRQKNGADGITPFSVPEAMLGSADVWWM